MKSLALALALVVAPAIVGVSVSEAEAKPRKGYYKVMKKKHVTHHRRYHRRQVRRQVTAPTPFNFFQPMVQQQTHRPVYGSNARPARWCGWWLRQQFGVRDTVYNLAHAWARWGSPASPYNARVGVMRKRHVGMVVGQCNNGVLLKSGNSGGPGGVSTRCYPISAFMAFRR